MIEAYVALFDKLLLGARENANSGCPHYQQSCPPCPTDPPGG